MPPKEFAISIIVPAFNEEANIAAAIENVQQAVDGLTDDYEILVINDGSKDRTAEIVREKIQHNSKIRLIDFEQNKGYGHVIKEGIHLASKKYFSFFQGDNDMAWESIRDLIVHSGEADIVTGYLKDMKKRAFFRRIVSRSFVLMMNGLFGMRLKYFNGPFICSCELLRSIVLKSSWMSIIAEIKVRLIKQGHSYKEIPFEHIGRVNGKSTALRWSAVMAVLSLTITLWKDIYLKKG